MESVFSLVSSNASMLAIHRFSVLMGYSLSHVVRLVFSFTLGRPNIKEKTDLAMRD